MQTLSNKKFIITGDAEVCMFYFNKIY